MFFLVYCFIVYYWLRLHQFPSPALFFFSFSYISFSYPPLFLSSALSSWPWSSFSSFVYFCFWMSLYFYHDCGLRICKNLPSFNTFAFFMKLMLPLRGDFTSPPNLINSTHFLVAFSPCFSYFCLLFEIMVPSAWSNHFNWMWWHFNWM